MLLCKHFLADFVFQSDYILCNRHKYGHPGGLLHATVHGALSGLIFLAFGTNLALVVMLVLGEIVAHYHIDWLKDNLNARLELTNQDKLYWILMGADQLLHQVTYVVMAWIWAMQYASQIAGQS